MCSGGLWSPLVDHDRDDEKFSSPTAPPGFVMPERSCSGHRSVDELGALHEEDALVREHVEQRDEDRPACRDRAFFVRGGKMPIMIAGEQRQSRDTEASATVPAAKPGGLRPRVAEITIATAIEIAHQQLVLVADARRKTFFTGSLRHRGRKIAISRPAAVGRAGSQTTCGDQRDHPVGQQRDLGRFAITMMCRRSP